MLNWLFDFFDGFTETWQVIIFCLCIVLGMLALVKGADYFVDGSSRIAKRIGVSSMVIGLTIVSFGTSAPEASVSISASLRDAADISLGNIVGSNIFNLLVVLGVSALTVPIVIKKSILNREIPFMIFTGLLLLITAILFGINGQYQLVMIEGIIFLIAFGVYLYLNIKNAKDEQSEEDNKTKKPLWISLLFLIGGLFLVIFGGELVTYGAKNIALEIGLSEAFVGLTIVAIGTSLPELVTSIVAAKKNENDIALGNVIGSNIFNIVFILGVVATISPLNVNANVIIDITIMLAMFIIFFVIVSVKKVVDKKLGILMIISYVLYLTYILLRDLHIFA